MALYQTNIVVILATPLLFIIIILITVLLEEPCVSHSFNSLWLQFDNEVYIFLSEHIPTSCVEPWFVLVGAWKSTEHNTGKAVIQH